MLDRVLEPEVMDSAQEAVDYDAMDHRAVNAAFVDDFLATAARLRVNLFQPAAEILDLGAGTAQIPLELVRREPRCQVLAVDLAAEMLNVGRRNIDAAGFTAQIRLELVDAKQLPYADEQFVAVMSNSIVHHIPEPIVVLAEACRVLRRGGLLFFRDLLRPADEATIGALVDAYAAGANAHQRQLFAASLRAALSLGEIRDLVGELGLDPSSVRQTTDRHWTWAERKA